MTSKEAFSLDETQLREQALLREDELLALEAILPTADFSRKATTNSSSSSQNDAVWLSVPANLPNGMNISIETIHFSLPATSEQDSDSHKQKALNTNSYFTTLTKVSGLAYLPPLQVLVHLPKEYPFFAPPVIMHIQSEYLDYKSTSSWNQPDIVSSLAASWRSRVVSWLKSTLYQQWRDVKGEILFSWYEYLKENLWQDIVSSTQPNCPLLKQFTQDLDLKEFHTQQDVAASINFESPLALSLRSNDILCKRKDFEGERFGCGICLEDKRGVKCWRIADCGHVFCQDCLSSFLSSMIREGYIRQASSCPDPECVKARVAAENHQHDSEDATAQGSFPSRHIGIISEAELMQFVGVDLVTRLVNLQDKALASKDPTAGYCPRPGCEKLVKADPSDKGTVYEAMRICQCGFTYCLYCNKAWHGKSPCNLVSSTALIEKYQRSKEDSSIRRQMELRYGKANLERMVRTYEEESQNKLYIESNTQKCPCCSVRIEKSMGCNHMTCRACNTHLCYRCGSRLNPREPYRHFNTPGTACFEKLFDHIGSVDAAPIDWDFIGADEEEMALWEAQEL